MPSKAAHPNAETLAQRIRAARGQEPCDLVIRGAKVLDVFGGGFYDGDVAVKGSMIVGTGEQYDDAAHIVQADGAVIIPGFIDAHVHIESSLMTPARFEEAVLPCGTTSVIWDPHEIANVKGVAGIEWALSSSEDLDLDVFVMIPSCVPSTSPELGLETSGAALKPADLTRFVGHPRVLGLAEMMNFPGLLGGDPEVLAKLQGFNGLRRDGHCPGLSGKDLNAYGVAGIHSCHESTTLAEAREKMRKGIHVLVREGSCAKDADVLLPLLTAYSSATLGLCSDDRNPLDIEEAGHISCIVDKALRAGHSPDTVFRAASHATAQLYGLDDRGAVAPGYLADFIIARPRDGRDWRSGFKVEAVYKAGTLVKETAHGAASGVKAAAPFGGARNLHLPAVDSATFKIAARQDGEQTVRMIGVIPRQIVTRSLTTTVPAKAGELHSDPSRDVLKIAVLERHHNTGGRAVGFVNGFGLKRGAIATSINHDSHNIIVVGADDAAMAEAVRELMRIDGGIVVVEGGGEGSRREHLQLPIGGLMTDAPPSSVATALRKLKDLAHACGCVLEEPFLTLSFLALPVIPTLKITDKGLVDVEAFRLVPVALDAE